jgi:hypothetical protein
LSRAAGISHTSSGCSGEQDAHRWFAGSVLAENGVNFARPDLKVDSVIRDDSWESLRDPARLQDLLTAL